MGGHDRVLNGRSITDRVTPRESLRAAIGDRRRRGGDPQRPTPSVVAAKAAFAACAERLDAHR
jgi:hypothetical protein